MSSALRVGDPISVAWCERVGVAPRARIDAEMVDAIKLWQRANGLTPDGILGRQSRAVALCPPEPGTQWPLVQAITYRPRLLFDRKIRLVVMHTMENTETASTAEAVAAWFAGKSGAPPRASAHACVDANSIVRCVLARDDAATAPGSNQDGYQIELAGRASQGGAGWADDYSRSMLGLAAGIAAEVARTWGIPVRRLTTAEVADGKTTGFCGHCDMPPDRNKSGHTDPGPTFPWNEFLKAVQDQL